MNAILKETFPKTKEIKGFILKLEKSLNYIPGQYVMIQFLDNEEKRAFSIVDYDPNKKELLLVIKKNDEFTQKLFNSEIGAVLDVRYNYTALGERLKAEDVYSGNVIYYICGPSTMIENFRSSLVTLGVENDNIRSEDFT